MNPSAGAWCAWEIAANETKETKFQYIEPIHLFIGICCLGGSPQYQNLQKYLDKEKQVAAQQEIAHLEKILEKLHVDTEVLIKIARTKLGLGTFSHAGGKISRNADCKKYFKRAEELAGDVSEYLSLHLLAALVEYPIAILNEVFQEIKVNSQDLYSEVLSSADRFQLPEAFGSGFFIMKQTGEADKGRPPPIENEIRNSYAEFEQKIKKFIMKVLPEAEKDSWWQKNLPEIWEKTKIKRDSAVLKATKLHETVSSSCIGYYLDFPDYKEIILQYWKDRNQRPLFEEYFPGKSMVIEYLSFLHFHRNIVMHSNPLPTDANVEKIRLYLTDFPTYFTKPSK